MLRPLQNCLVAEEQAIAIYQAECLLLAWTPVTSGRRATLALCRRILKEEKEHRSLIREHLEGSIVLEARLTLARFGGYLLGLLLSALPSRLSWRIHSWAEREAAQIYGAAAAHPLSDGLAGTLRHAENQELEHARAFHEKSILRA
jgi:hypothetical protein